MITRYMSSYHDYKGYILSNRNVEFDEKIFPNICSVTINKTGKFKEGSVNSSSYSAYEILKIVRKLADENDKVIFNFYHFHPKHFVLSYLFKILFKNVFTYIKLDIRNEIAKDLFKNSKFYKKKIRNYLIKKVDFLSCETNIALGYLKNYECFKDNLSLISNGYFSDDNIISSYSQNFISNKEKIIFTAGRLESYEKNIYLLIDSFIVSHLWKDGWKLILAGSYDDNLDKYINDKLLSDLSGFSTSIKLTGHLNREQLFSYMSRSRIFSLCSRWEGFALVLPEAAANGCIIAATDVGGVRDITNDGEFGFVADEQTIPSFTNTLRLAASSTLELNKNQMDYAVLKFDWRNITDKLAYIINEKIK
uniref:Glycosyl transferase, group 1 n=2 Tax=Shewanella putrefaciens TaxID=24 RepID=A4Y8H4_SHEPC